jgi:hypothetical protein
MRKIFFIAIICLIAQHTFAQDKIVKLNGETINCKITEIGISTIKYKGEGEDFIRNVVSGKVQEIIFKSGKVEKLNKRIVVLGENDWEKVQIVNVNSDVTGLIKGEEIKATVNGSRSATTESKIKNKALQKLKKIAASKGYHTVVLLNTKRLGAHSGKSRGGIKASVTGVGYSY